MDHMSRTVAGARIGDPVEREKQFSEPSSSHAAWAMRNMPREKPAEVDGALDMHRAPSNISTDTMLAPTAGSMVSKLRQTGASGDRLRSHAEPRAVFKRLT